VSEGRDEGRLFVVSVIAWWGEKRRSGRRMTPPRHDAAGGSLRAVRAEEQVAGRTEEISSCEIIEKSRGKNNSLASCRWSPLGQERDRDALKGRRKASDLTAKRGLSHVVRFRRKS